MWLILRVWDEDRGDFDEFIGKSETDLGRLGLATLPSGQALEVNLDRGGICNVEVSYTDTADDEASL